MGRRDDFWGDVAELMPWRVAGKWGNPDFDSGGSNQVLGWLANCRALLGLATLVVVGIYTSTRDPGQVLIEEGWEKSSKNVVFALVIVPAGMILTYFLITKASYRKGFEWWPTIRRILLMIATTLGPMTPIILIGSGAIPEHAENVSFFVMLAILWIAGFILLWRYFSPTFAVIVGGLFGYVFAIVLYLILILWLVVYICCVAFWASRTSCWIGLFHPLLAPALSALVVLYFTVDALVAADTKGVPMDLWLWLTLGGLVSTLALVIAEHETLRKQEGYRWRYGPDRYPRQKRQSFGYLPKQW